MITHDPLTWPVGDSIWNICHAIALAEGANVPNSNPDRLNNPGDISDFVGVFGSEYHSGSHITHFPTKEIGWGHLHWKVNRIIKGMSSTYTSSWSWEKVAKTWAANWEPWLKTVTEHLGVKSDSTPLDYIKSRS